MPKIEVREGMSFNYEEVGEGFPVVFGHSYLWNLEMWRPQIEELSKSFRCIVPDLWGHGESSTFEDKETSIKQLADDFYAFTQALELKEFAIVGLSVGGMWGTQLALDHPEAVKGLVVMDSFVGPEPKPTLDKYFGLLAMIEQAGAVPPPLADQITPMFFSPYTMEHKQELPTAFHQSLCDMPKEKVHTVVTLGRAIFARESLLERLPELKMPCMMIVGEDDMPRPPHESKQMADLIHACEVKLIPESGHICNLEQPEMVNEILDNFLSKVANIS